MSGSSARFWGSRISTKVYGWKLKRSVHARREQDCLQYMVRNRRIGELADARSLPEQLEHC